MCAHFAFQSQTALLSEIDKISTLWDDLEKQVTSKVFELQSYEDKVSKARHDVGFTIASFGAPL